MQINGVVPTQNGVSDPNASSISAACQQLSSGLFELSSQGVVTPSQPQQVTMVNGAVRPVQLNQQPIGQPNVPINQQAAVPPQCKCYFTPNGTKINTHPGVLTNKQQYNLNVSVILHPLGLKLTPTVC